MAIEDFNHIKDVLSTLDLKRPSRFAYTQEALDATGAAEITALTGIYAPEDSSQINSIPDPVQVAMDSVVVSVGLRTQAATLSRLMVNHFFGRFSLNIVKLTEKIKLLVSDHLVNRYITTSGKIVENIGVTPQATTVDLVQNRSPLAAQVPTTETLTVSIPAAVHSGNAGVMTGADKAVLDNIISAGLPGKQPLDSDLTAIAGLTPANDDVIQRISGSWVNRTMAQLKTSLGLNNVTNESKATMFTNPTFTGTPTGVTKAHVGLGNVDNQSKATMFTSPVFTGNIPELPAVNPTTGNQAAHKTYVDTKMAAVDLSICAKNNFARNVVLSAGNLIVPAGVRIFIVTLVGGGGGGSGGSSSYGGGGGGGGGVATFLMPVTPGETLTITYGAGGVSGATNGGGGTGGRTQINAGNFVCGGYGGNGNATGGVGAGGGADGSTAGVAGGGGSGGGPGAAAGGYITGGAGGYGGGAGGVGSAANVIGGNGGLGAGGGGGGSNRAGGAGGAGYIIYSYM